MVTDHLVKECHIDLKIEWGNMGQNKVRAVLTEGCSACTGAVITRIAQNTTILFRDAEQQDYGRKSQRLLPIKQFIVKEGLRRLLSVSENHQL